MPIAMDESKSPEPETDFINPIDPDKVVENAHLLPYATSIGSSIVKPLDRGRIKGQAMAAMYEQTDMQLDQIRRQIELLAEQARAIQNRVLLSEAIYEAETNFRPVVGHVYHLYQKADGAHVLSMIGPDEWGRKGSPYVFEATVRLMADHTWDIITSQAYS